MSMAMDQQNAATQEIARNVLQAADGTEAAATNISNVTAAAGESGAAAAQILESSDGLAAQSTQLNEEVASFLENVRGT